MANTKNNVAVEKSVKAEIERMQIPTYGLGNSEINPVFFEKRVYQGSSGKVYPVPFIDKVYDHKTNVSYKAAILENEYIRLVMLPEIGGRIFEARDKKNNDYHFFYQQKVIKPALVGLAGPWISGGIEFNWPQHHRPGTYLPTDVFIEEEADGVRTIWMSEYDPMYRLKGMHGIRLRPDSSLIEIRGRLFNRTPVTQTFLWWANMAVRVHEEYESFFPSDVHYVADHAVRAMSSFPFAENEYYGIPYHQRQGKNDLRRYNNIPVPTSYMVCDTNYDFFGGYDHKANGGFVHVANSHISPGKKQWTWGSEEFGKAWDRELTDEGGPYFELMAGVYTDNQPDFSYLLPYETKTFSQYLWSYKDLGPVQNANKDLAVKLEFIKEKRLRIGIVSSRHFATLRVVVTKGGKDYTFNRIKLSPGESWIDHSVSIEEGDKNGLMISVMDQNNTELISYKHHEVEKERKRKLAFEPDLPSDVKSSNELTQIGEHLEYYRHPTRYPEPYFKEAIVRDPSNYKPHIDLGRLYLKNGEFLQAENHLSDAIRILTKYHPNPTTGEAHYYCGLACLNQEKTEEAYKLFYKSTWNFEWRSAAYYQLSLLDCRRGDFSKALEHLEFSLDTNRQNNSALILKASILNRMERNTEARLILEDMLKNDPLDQWARFEFASQNNRFSEFLKSSRNDAQTIIDIAFEYADAGFYTKAVSLIELHLENEIPVCSVPNPMSSSVMPGFIKAWLMDKIGRQQHAREILELSVSQSYDYFFPSRIGEQRVLEWVLEKMPNNSLAAFGLGNYYYNLKRYEDAIAVWEQAVDNNCTYGTLYRNLGIAYWNTRNDGVMARNCYIRAIEYSKDDLRIRYEFDQLRKKLNEEPMARLESLLPMSNKIMNRDDFSVELAALYNFNGQYKEALRLLEKKIFHPWEGGEGQVLKQYNQACLSLGQQELKNGKAYKALEYFNRSIDTPENLGEKYHPLQAVAHINYWKAKAFQTMGKNKEAEKHFLLSVEENGDFIDMSVSEYSELSYYRALSLIELKMVRKANILLEKIRKFAISRINSEVNIDYFATSLPLLLVFEEDIVKRNEWEAKYLLALVEKELGNQKISTRLLKEVLALNSMHQGAKERLEA